MLVDHLKFAEHSFDILTQKLLNLNYLELLNNFKGFETRPLSSTFVYDM